MSSAPFARVNPLSDRFQMWKYHHVEYYCADASTHAARLQWALGMHLVAKSDQTTGNQTYASYVIQSNDMTFVCTAPYSTQTDKGTNNNMANPGYNAYEAHDFVRRHGFAIRALGILVDDAEVAYDQCVANGGIPVLKTVTLVDETTKGSVKLSEIKAYGDVVLRFVSKHGYTGAFLPKYEKVDAPVFSYGLERVDHVVGNVPRMKEVVEYLMKATGMHYYAEFSTEDVGTIDSGLNSAVLSNNNHMVLMPLNEPTFGTVRKSQIQTYLEQNEGPGAQHVALKTANIFETLREMRQRRYLGGFEFLPRPNDKYYANAKLRIGKDITDEQYELCKEYGVLLDKDEQGILLQIFTRPVGDRATLFFEIIQRVGCMECVEEQVAETKKMPAGEYLDTQVGGCGGFGKGNFAELFKSIEDYERVLDGTAKLNADNTIQIVNKPC